MELNISSTPASLALARLKAGNSRYSADPRSCIETLVDRRASLINGQAPFAAVLACSDSRSPVELIFGGLGPGELFVVRNAGNVSDTTTLGSIEYAVQVLQVPLVVVMGHQNCGAVSAACDVVRGSTSWGGFIGKMIRPIIPVAKESYHHDYDTMLDNSIRANAHNTSIMIASTIPAIANSKGNVVVLSARYDLETGLVDFMEAPHE